MVWYNKTRLLLLKLFKNQEYEIGDKNDPYFIAPQSK